MKIKRMWIEYDDERGDRYMAPATESDVTAWLAERGNAGAANKPEIRSGVLFIERSRARVLFEV